MKVRVWLALSSAALLIGIGACGDHELTNPLTPSPSGGSAFASKASAPASQDIVLALKRSTRLREDLSTSGVIGPWGGSLEIAEAGIRVDFSRGAVTVPTRITLTASAGHHVAYEFEPHGLNFSAPVVVRQNLQNTAAEHDRKLAALLQGSYYEGDLGARFVDAKREYVRTRETRKGKLYGRDRFLEFSIEHFSGYMVSVGQPPVEIEVEVRGH